MSNPSLPPFRDSLLGALGCTKNLVCYTDDASLVVEQLRKQKLPYVIWDNYDNIESREKPFNAHILVLPNLDKTLGWQQDRLGRYLQDMRALDPTPFFIAIATVSSSFVPHRHMTAYLKRQFWFACAEPQPGSQDVLSIDEASLARYRAALAEVFVHPSVRRYVLDLIIHIRVHRLAKQATGGGCSTNALKDMLAVCQVLALLQGKSFVIPDIVKTASMWYFPFHIDLIEDPADEISLQYGSDPALVADLVHKLQNFSLSKSVETNYPLYFQFMVLRDVLSNVIPAI
ncbi:LAFE_0F07624g1_1 [Lachancea fermentati]|uniref:LAFE_0F07624g1_1 n=1 Tax=Lachancea fermentati TaxID=4955 RepID=A0A1G4MF06_LACFM|nr:LAFE_0F07624g1_1 [Lachancea fermentati]